MQLVALLAALGFCPLDPLVRPQLGYGVITATAQCGRGVEGRGGEKLVAVARRIARLGRTLRYLAMDEPQYWLMLYDRPNACRWQPPEMAANTASNIRALLTAFPA